MKKYEIKKYARILAAILLVIGVFVWFFVIGFDYGDGHYFIGYSSHLKHSISQYKNLISSFQGKDIFGASISIIAFSVLLLLNSIIYLVVSKKYSLGMKFNIYIINFLLVFVILGLSVTILIEYLKSSSLYVNSSFQLSSLIAILVFGLLFPILVLVLNFNKEINYKIAKLIKTMYQVK